MEAQIEGRQRKVFGARVRPLRGAAGTEGIVLSDGRTLPFRVTRSWSAPAGVYPETWYLVRPETHEVFLEGPVQEVAIWGLQGLTDVVDDIREPIALEPGTYSVVFALGGVKGGEIEVEVTDASGEQAA